MRNIRIGGSRRVRSSPRRGNAAVELAITLPLIVTVVFGSIEVCSLMQTQQIVQSVAYECARVAVQAEATDAEVQTRMTEIFSQRGITNGAVTTTPASIQGLNRGTPITVVASADAANNTMVQLKFFTELQIQSSCVMVKEL